MPFILSFPVDCLQGDRSFRLFYSLMSIAKFIALMKTWCDAISVQQVLRKFPPGASGRTEGRLKKYEKDRDLPENWIRRWHSRHAGPARGIGQAPAGKWRRPSWRLQLHLVETSKSNIANPSIPTYGLDSELGTRRSLQRKGRTDRNPNKSSRHEPWAKAGPLASY